MKGITKVFFTGLATVLPLLATFYLLYWLTTTIESVLGGVLKIFLTERFYIPGMGIGLGVVLIFVVGLLMRSWFAQIIFSMWEGFLLRLPLIKSIYSAAIPARYNRWFRCGSRTAIFASSASSPVTTSAHCPGVLARRMRSPSTCP